MADDFGLRLGIEGEAQFKNALRDINQSFKVLGSEMALVTSQFDKNDKSVGALTSRNEVLNKEIGAQKGKVETLRAALDNASASFGESDKRTQNWQIQLNKAQAELNGMERELAANNTELAAAGKEFDRAGSEAGDFGKELGGAGRETDQFGRSLDNAEKELSDAEKSTSKLEDSLSGAEKELSAKGKETDSLGSEMEDTTKKTSIFGDVLKDNLAADAIKAKAQKLFNDLKKRPPPRRSGCRIWQARLKR